MNDVVNLARGSRQESPGYMSASLAAKYRACMAGLKPSNLETLQSQRNNITRPKWIEQGFSEEYIFQGNAEAHIKKVYPNPLISHDQMQYIPITQV